MTLTSENGHRPSSVTHDPWHATLTGMHVVDAPPLAPGACALTKTSVGPMVDTLIDDDVLPQGRIYISEDAVVTMAELFGMVTADWADAMTETLETFQKALEETKQELARERELNQALINARADIKEHAHAS